MALMSDPSAPSRRTALLVPLIAALGASAATTAGAGPSGSGSASANSYVRMPTLTATVMRRDGRRGVMTVEAGLDVPDGALRTLTEQSLPRLRAAYTPLISRMAEGLLPAEPPDLERLVRDLQQATDALLGQRGARILLGTVMVN